MAISSSFPTLLWILMLSTAGIAAVHHEDQTDKTEKKIGKK